MSVGFGEVGSGNGEAEAARQIQCAVLTTLTDGWGTPRKDADECTPRTVLASARAYRRCLSWHPDLAATRRAMLCRVPLATRTGW